jgi:NitT/TauT family transport system substrate-binding protein
MIFMNQNRFRNFASLATCLVAICLLAFAGCNRNQNATTQPAALKFTLDWNPEPEFGGFYAAQINHSFEGYGLNLDMKPAGEGAPVTQLVATGKATFGTAGADEVVVARVNGADVVGIFAVYQVNPQGVMVHKARGFKSLADVFNNPGVLEAENANWLKYCTQKYGTNGVKIIENSEGIAAFIAKPDYSKQCYVTSEPILAAAQHSDPQAFLIADSGFDPYTTMVITSGETVRKNPALVRSMINACRAGWTAYLNDPAPANAFMETLNHAMDPQTFTKAAEAQAKLIQTAEGAPLGMMTEQRWNELTKQMLELKAITQPVAGKDCFVTEAQLK